jgi:hypothetical protein
MKHLLLKLIKFIIIYIYDNINYIGIKNKINILCKYHGYFEQTPNDHLQGNGCYLCAGLIRNTDDFYKKSINYS